MDINFMDIQKHYKEENKARKKQRNFIYAISIDIKKKKEHIVVGEEFEVINFLNTGIGDVLYNQKVPLGNFFLTFPTDNEKSWAEFCNSILKFYKSSTFPKNCKNDMIFLKNRFNTNHPVEMLCAVQVFLQTIYSYKMNNSTAIFNENTQYLHKYFLKNRLEYLWETYRLNEKDYFADGENDIKVHYTNSGTEYILVYKSFKPLISMYLKKLRDNNLDFSQCTICGEIFIANHKHTKFCSDTCKKVQVVRNKEVFVENNKDLEYMVQYNSTYTFWYNRVKVLRNKLSDEKGVSEMEGRFKKFKNKSAEYKRKLKNNKIKEKDFIRFLKDEEVWINRFYYNHKKFND